MCRDSINNMIDINHSITIMTLSILAVINISGNNHSNTSNKSNKSTSTSNKKEHFPVPYCVADHDPENLEQLGLH